MKKSTEPRWRVARGSTSGFTLLEVLAAVAILGIWYAVLASVAIQGLRAEGENERRIRASLIADREMADMELELEAAEFPSEETEDEEDEFIVRRKPVLVAESPELLESNPDLAMLLAGDLVESAQDLYWLEVEVEWIEGAVEERLRRGTYAWDNSRLFEALDQQATGGSDDGGAGSTRAPIDGGEDGEQ